MRKLNRFRSISLVACVLVLTACGNKEDSGDANKNQSEKIIQKSVVNKVVPVNTLNIKQVKKILDERMFIDNEALKAKSSIAALKLSEPNNPEVWTESARFEIKCGFLGKHCERDGMFDRALNDVLHAQSIAPDFAESWSLAGHIYTKTGEYKKAYESLDKAILLDPTHAWANVNYATLINDRGFGEGFFKDDDHAEVLKDKFQRTEKAFEYLKVVLDGDYPKRVQSVALSECKDLSFSNPDMDIYCNQATLDNKLYKKELEKAWAYGNMASIYLGSKKDYKKAIENAEAALKIAKYRDARITLAGAYLGLWMDSGFKDDVYLEKSIEAEPITVEVVNKMYPRFFHTELLPELYKKINIDYSMRDLKGQTLLYRAFGFYMGNGDAKYFEEMLRDFKVDPNMPIRVNRKITTLPELIETRIKSPRISNKQKYLEARELLDKYSKNK